jgi:hypothetical protein
LKERLDRRQGVAAGALVAGAKTGAEALRAQESTTRKRGSYDLSLRKKNQEIYECSPKEAINIQKNIEKIVESRSCSFEEAVAIEAKLREKIAKVKDSAFARRKRPQGKAVAGSLGQNARLRPDSSDDKS